MIEAQFFIKSPTKGRTLHSNTQSCDDTKIDQPKMGIKQWYLNLTIWSIQRIGY